MAWAKIPTSWIVSDKKLPLLSWQKDKSDATAALILFISLAILLNRSNKEKQEAQDRDLLSFECSYNSLQAFTALSRAKIAAGLHLLEDKELINISRESKTNRYFLLGVTESGKWAKLPQTHVLTGVGRGPFFSTFHLRHQTELNALKLYLLLIAYRNTTTNFTVIGYEKISELSGIMKSHVRSALSLLIHYDLVRVDQSEPLDGKIGHPHNRYRIRGL